ncbi:monothiol glutaredoxin [Strigomonas culicis]|uniref:Monothiol glutaredoxin n=1 Tax=Strigomonas culicis TaxID=28005 RepID=S9UFC6_9TRYP|nr:monothiol glutaredoxin [Strigomonas culicis]|eukprot:EPY29517.1 monothiol glutaredoxin [Strigomonas culicis]
MRRLCMSVLASRVRTTAGATLLPIASGSLRVEPSLRASMRFASSTPKEGLPPIGGDVEENEETHPDFQPRMVASDLAADEIAMIKKDIDDTIKEEDIVIFIKGVPEAPMCAFSMRMVDAMDALGVEYTAFDVLAHPVVRTYVKEVSQWPTIPQLFVKGEFAGGIDIVLKMAEGGELQMLLEQKGIKHRTQNK